MDFGVLFYLHYQNLNRKEAEQGEHLLLCLLLCNFAVEQSQKPKDTMCKEYVEEITKLLEKYTNIPSLNKMHQILIKKNPQT